MAGAKQFQQIRRILMMGATSRADEHADDLRPRCSEREAQTNFAAPFLCGIGKHAEHANSCKRESKHAYAPRDRGACPRFLEAPPDVVADRPCPHCR